MINLHRLSAHCFWPCNKESHVQHSCLPYVYQTLICTMTSKTFYARLAYSCFICGHKLVCKMIQLKGRTIHSYSYIRYINNGNPHQVFEIVATPIQVFVQNVDQKQKLTLHPKASNTGIDWARLDGLRVCICVFLESEATRDHTHSSVGLHSVMLLLFASGI